MTALRTIVFYILFLVVTGLFCLCGLLLMPFKRSLMMEAIFIWSKTIALMEKVILGLTFKVEGRENIPTTPCLIASKHQSAWETCKMFLILGDCAIVLKEELTRMPILKWYAQKTAMIPIDRKGRVRSLTKMMRAAHEALAQNRHIVIFPQGTRVNPGEKKPYKSGFVALYHDLNVPLVPVALNSGLFWSRSGFPIKPGCITVKFLPPIEAGLSKKEVIERLAAAIEPASDALLPQEKAASQTAS